MSKSKKLLYSVLGLVLVGAISLIIYFQLKFNEKPANENELNTNIKIEISYHEVKYYFDNLETFDKNMPSNIETQTFIKGKLVEEEHQVVCKTGPCPPIKAYYLQDLNEKKYKIYLYNNELVKKLTVNNIYILKGELRKLLKMTVPFENCDKDLCKYEISLFWPEEIIQEEI